jgi:solute carrier family 25 (mitochondrial phosphate transporter), member 23/24/25/41
VSIFNNIGSTVLILCAGAILGPSTSINFIAFLTSSPHPHSINFREFRDFLLLLPRKPSAAEIYKYYEVMKTIGANEGGTALVDAEGPLTISLTDFNLMA